MKKKFYHCSDCHDTGYCSPGYTFLYWNKGWDWRKKYHITCNRYPSCWEARKKHLARKRKESLLAHQRAIS